MYMIRWTRSRHQIEVTLYTVQPSALFIGCTAWWCPVRCRNMELISGYHHLHLRFNFVILTNITGMSHLKVMFLWFWLTQRGCRTSKRVTKLWHTGKKKISKKNTAQNHALSSFPDFSLYICSSSLAVSFQDLQSLIFTSSWPSPPPIRSC
jgi:hypothetical protein